MSYPKPVSEKTLERLYKEAGITENKRSFLHTFFAACSNLYGAINLRSAWAVYQELKDVPKLHRKDLLAFAAIARRESQPYYVYEIEELYSEEKHSELDRYIVNKELVGYGYGKFRLFYEVEEENYNKPYCVPDDFLSYAAPIRSAEESALFDYLSDLTSTADVCAPKYGEAVPNDHKGMKLAEFSFLNSDERFFIDYEKRPAAKQALLEEYSGTEAEKILRFVKRGENISGDPNRTLKRITDEVSEAGVKLKRGQLDTLLRLVTDYHNNSRLWCLAGWKPGELARKYRGNGPIAISFGPGMQQSFADGSLDKEELVRKIREMGLEVIDEKGSI